jgi:aminopeptidase N
MREPEPARSWLAGRDVPEGLKIDADLRWALLLRLAVQGELGEEEIEGELARDATARGAQEAARCRAARPDPAAKATAFELIVADRVLSNRVLEAIGRGFWRPEQPELTDEYVPRFFAALPATQEWRSGHLLGLVGRSAYPIHAAYDSTVEAAERLLAVPDLNPQLRRAVVDATDDLRRAIRQRSLWGAGQG